jgi:nitrate reductase NapD
MNISSVIVNANPAKLPLVRTGLESISGVEVHAATEDGRLVITIETEDNGAIVGTFERIQTLDGVMSAAMVYHQFESDPEKEI